MENTGRINKNCITKNSVIGLCLIFSENMRWGGHYEWGRLQMRTNILDWKHERRVQLKDNRTDGTTVKWSWNKFGVSITLGLLGSDRCPVEVCCRHSTVQYHAQNLLTTWGTINYRRPPRHDIIVRQGKKQSFREILLNWLLHFANMKLSEMYYDNACLLTWQNFMLS